MKKQHRFSPPAIGASALLTAFGILVLCVFALLSLTAVQAEARLCAASAESISAYYAADLQAEEILAALRSGELPAGVQQKNNLFTYTCPISHNQWLQVTVQKNGEHFDILQWQVLVGDLQSNDETLHLWLGGTS